MENQNSNNYINNNSNDINSSHDTILINKRAIIPSSFSLILVLFFFTFCDLKCGNQKIGSIKGIDLVIGSSFTKSENILNPNSKEEKVPPNIWAILSFMSAIVGLGSFLRKDKIEALICISAAILGFISLIILNYNISTTIRENSSGQIDTLFLLPYYGSLTCFIIAGVASYFFKKNNNYSNNLDANNETISSKSILDSIISLNKYIYSVPLCLIGIIHFLKADQMSAITPGGQTIVFLTGTCLILSSISVFLKKYDKLASVLLALMLLLFMIPHLQNMNNNEAELFNILKNIALAGGALLYAGQAKDNTYIG